LFFVIDSELFILKCWVNVKLLVYFLNWSLTIQSYDYPFCKSINKDVDLTF
jgi:hypothetical protein